MRLHVGKRSWLIHHSMAALEEGLDPELFVRLHRSAIVRRDFIAGFSRNPSGRWIARLGDGSEQPVGRLYADQVRRSPGARPYLGLKQVAARKRVGMSGVSPPRVASDKTARAAELHLLDGTPYLARPTSSGG